MIRVKAFRFLSLLAPFNKILKSEISGLFSLGHIKPQMMDLTLYPNPHTRNTG